MNEPKLLKKRKWYLSSGVIRGVMIILGGIFIAASIPKILHPGEFAEIVFNYQILPGRLINLFAIVLPWLEFVTGIMLMFRIWSEGAVIIVNLLLLIFVTVMAYDLTRGLDISCGCFSTNINAGPANFLYLIRDIVFSLMGIFLFFNVVIKRNSGK